jgi:hypothetical protein
MPYKVDFENVSLVGLEAADYPKELAGVRANEARYYKNKYNHDFEVVSAAEGKGIVDYVSGILKKERDIVIGSEPLEVASFQVENLKMAYVFYKSGLSVNVMYTIDNPKKRAVGFKLCMGMEIPDELKTRFKFARQKSKLAGEIRGSFFVIKGEY